MTLPEVELTETFGTITTPANANTMTDVSTQPQDMVSNMDDDMDALSCMAVDENDYAAPKGKLSVADVIISNGYQI